MDNIDWNKIVKDALGWMYGIITFAFPWFANVIHMLMKIVVLVEVAGELDPSKKPQKLQAAIDNFEAYLVEEGYIPQNIENLVDPLLDWAIKEAVTKIVDFLNKHFGKQWLQYFKQQAKGA